MAEEQIPLIPKEPYTPPADFDLIVHLLQQVTKISVITDHLKAKQLTFSAGSWADLKDKRLLPALEKNQIEIKELMALLSEAEEYGRSHTFLYKCGPEEAQSLLDVATVNATAAHLGLSSCLGLGKVLDQPADPTITAIRIEDDKRAKILTIKVIEKRIEHKYVGEKIEDSILSKRWKIEEARAVNVIRLFSTGLLEVRIASHQTSKRYDADIQRIMKIVSAFIPHAKFTEFSLGDAKIVLWNKRETDREKVRFSNSKLRNSVGSTLVAACGEEEGDLFKDQSLSDSLGEFWKSGDAYCESSNLYWLAGKEGSLPSEEIHMILPELRNEFAIPAHCSKADYEYVFDQLRALSG